MLFENSIVCLVVFVCCLFFAALRRPVLGCGFLCQFVFWLLGQACSDSNSPVCVMGCFCLESLILAQDERWRRA